MADGAIMHLCVSTVSRATGRSAVAAAAYRAGTKLVDARTGVEHDYRRKRGVMDSFIAAPDGCGWITDRQTLWDAAEAAEGRKNSVVAREWLVALPDALDAAQRAELTRALAVELVTRFDVAVDVAIHAPPKKGDERNHHAHLMATTRTAGPDGLGEKTRVLDSAKTGGPEIESMREWWAGTVNDALAAAQSAARIDHRRKAVVVAEKATEAKVLEMQAADVAASPADAEKLRNKARYLRAIADRASSPPAEHQGPVRTAFRRRLEARKAAEEVAERTREAMRAAEARKNEEAVKARSRQDAQEARKKAAEARTEAAALELTRLAPAGRALIEQDRRRVILAEKRRHARIGPEWVAVERAPRPDDLDAAAWWVAKGNGKRLDESPWLPAKAAWITEFKEALTRAWQWIASLMDRADPAADHAAARWAGLHEQQPAVMDEWRELVEQDAQAALQEGHRYPETQKPAGPESRFNP